MSISRLYGKYKGLISQDRIRQTIVDAGLSIRHNDFYATRYSYDISYFKNIDNEHKAYWLGFIAADGCVKNPNKAGVKKLSLEVSSVDRGHLEKFKEDIKYTGEIRDYISNHDTSYSRIYVSNGSIANDLDTLGVHERKSLTIRFDDFDVPKHLMKHFIRGYFDGNGCITYAIRRPNRTTFKITICSTENMLRGIEQYLTPGRKIKKLDKRHKNDTDNYQLHIGGMNQVAYALNYMYKDADIYLQRKYNKYLEFLQVYNQSRA